MHLSKQIGKRLQEQRIIRGYTQEEFAKAMGVVKRTQASYEAGDAEPKAGYLCKAAALGVDVLFVMTGMPAPTPAESLSPVEAKVLDNYRALAVEDQAAVHRLTTSLAESVQNTKLNKASSE
jgi:transcriptional regulator with XRE-family HTH domain